MYIVPAYIIVKGWTRMYLSIAFCWVEDGIFLKKTILYREGVEEISIVFVAEVLRGRWGTLTLWLIFKKF